MQTFNSAHVTASNRFAVKAKRSLILVWIAVVRSRHFPNRRFPLPTFGVYHSLPVAEWPYKYRYRVGVPNTHRADVEKKRVLFSPLVSRRFCVGLHTGRDRSPTTRAVTSTSDRIRSNPNPYISVRSGARIGKRYPTHVRFRRAFSITPTFERSEPRRGCTETRVALIRRPASEASARQPK